MKYCVNCGEKVLDNAPMCAKCGFWLKEYTLKDIKHCKDCGEKITDIDDDYLECPNCGEDIEPKINPYRKGAQVFMILAIAIRIIFAIACIVLAGISGVYEWLIYMYLSLIALAWIIPMAISLTRQIENGLSVSTSFGVCTLLFVSLIAGILLLCAPTEIVPMRYNNIKQEKENIITHTDDEEEITEKVSYENNDKKDREDVLRERIEKIKKMKDDGVITDQEYDTLKAKVLEEF